MCAKIGPIAASIGGVPTPEELADAARARAAIAFAGTDYDVVAEALGMSRRSLDRVLAAERPLSVPEARALARQCRIPVDFLLRGWEVAEDPIASRITELQSAMAELVGLLTDKPDAKASLGDQIARVVEEAMTQRAREVGLRGHRRPQPRLEEEKPHAA